MIKVGDTVRYLDSVGGGKVTRINGSIVYVDDDGFETPVAARNCVVVAHADASAETFKSKTADASPKADTAAAVLNENVETIEPAEETPEGEKLNVVLAYEARDLRNLSNTTYDTYLVNDSNYYLYFTYLTCGDDNGQWTAIYAGMIEPGIQLLLAEVTNSDLQNLSRVAIQYVAFKRDRQFAMKPSATVEYRLDVTKFFKLHCFRENPYFDTPVIALDIVKDDVPQRQIQVNAAEIEHDMMQKAAADRRPAKKLHNRKQHTDDQLVVDLHINELVDSTRGLSNADMLNLQVDKFREVMDANLKRHGKKIIFIHGKGEGVLRQALVKELTHRYKGHDVQDASFREYGFGATQVTIR